MRARMRGLEMGWQRWLVLLFVAVMVWGVTSTYERYRGTELSRVPERRRVSPPPALASVTGPGTVDRTGSGPRDVPGLRDRSVALE